MNAAKCEEVVAHNVVRAMRHGSAQLTGKCATHVNGRITLRPAARTLRLTIFRTTRTIISTCLTLASAASARTQEKIGQYAERRTAAKLK